MNLQSTDKECRVCGSTRIIDLGIEKNFYLLNLDQNLPHSYSACQDCQFIFQSGYLGDAFIQNYYNQSLMYRRAETSNIETLVYKLQADFVQRRFDLYGKKVLEIGCDTGQFLAYLKYAYNCEVYFDELSENAREILLQRGFLKDYRAGKDRPPLDLVVMRHVLEHIHGLDGFLESLWSSISPQGGLFIEVPDWSLLDSATDAFHFEHINQFNSVNLPILLKRNGFVVTNLEQDQTEGAVSTPNRVLRVFAKKSTLASLGKANFKEDVANHHAWLESHYTKLEALLGTLAQTAKIAIAPASHLAFEAYTSTSLAKRQVLGFFDNDPKKLSKKPYGLSVKPAAEVTAAAPDCILILTIGGFADEMAKQYSALCPSVPLYTLDQIQAL